MYGQFQEDVGDGVIKDFMADHNKNTHIESIMVNFQYWDSHAHSSHQSLDDAQSYIGFLMFFLIDKLSKIPN